MHHGGLWPVTLQSLDQQRSGLAINSNCMCEKKASFSALSSVTGFQGEPLWGALEPPYTMAVPYRALRRRRRSHLSPDTSRAIALRVKSTIVSLPC